MATLQELLAQLAELEKQIATTQSAERSEAIAKVKTLMSEYNLSLDDLQRGSRSAPDSDAKRNGAAKGSKVAAKFKDPESGATWSGRGLKPKWLKAALDAGKKIEEFAI